MLKRKLKIVYNIPNWTVVFKKFNLVRENVRLDNYILFPFHGET